MRFGAAVAALAFLAGGAVAQDKSAKDGAPADVPFRLTRTQHFMVRAKINGKGPFHLIVDTGCPVLLLSSEAAKKAGLDVEKGAATIERFEIEGGVGLDKVRARVETPFQIEGMNAMGLPGVELHGLLGYTVLAKYRMEVDADKDKMRWTPLAFDPPPPEALKSKAGTGGIEMLGGLMKVLAKFSGLKPGPAAEPRGFVGLETALKDGKVVVARVYPGGPAADAEIQVGDVVERIGDKKIATPADVSAALAQTRVGQTAVFALKRGDASRTASVKTGAGF